MNLRLSRFHRVGTAVHGVALSADGEHLLIGSEHGLGLVDRRGNVRHRVSGRAFSAVALAPQLEAGLAMERAGRLLWLRFEPMHVAATGIWEQRDDLYSLDYAPQAGERGLIALGHHALGLTALDGRGQLLWRLGPREAADGEDHGRVGRRTWHAAISPDGRTIYAAALSGGEPGQHAEIVAIDAALGKPVQTAQVAGRVTLLATLPAPLGVAAVLNVGRGSTACCQLLGFDADLGRVAWTLTCPPDTVITAVSAAVSQAALIVGGNTGELWRIGAYTGRILARYDLLFGSTVLSLAVAENGEIAAGLANGQVAFLEQARA